MDPSTVAALQSSWNTLLPDTPERQAKSDQLALTVFGKLFSLDPALIKLFPFQDAEGNVDPEKPSPKFESHVRVLMTTIGTVVKALDDVPAAAQAVTAVVKRHVNYGVQEPHYALLEAAFMGALDDAVAGNWPDNHREAWVSFFAVLKSIAAGVYAEVGAAAETGAPTRIDAPVAEVTS